MDFVQKVKLFNEVAGTEEKFDPRKAALYVGLVLEEVAEMLESIATNVIIQEDKESWQENIDYLNSFADNFKKGEYDGNVAACDRLQFLDAAVDIAVVSIGAGIAIGADINGATHAVADNNLTKFPIVDGKHTVLRDENGKVRKPEGFKAVELHSFLY